MTNHGPEAFSTERLDATPLRAAHAEEMAAVLADPALHTYTGGAPEDLDILRARYTRWESGSPTLPNTGGTGYSGSAPTAAWRAGSRPRWWVGGPRSPG